MYAATTPAPWMAQQRPFSPQPHYVPQQQFSPPKTYQQPNQHLQGPRAPPRQRALEQRFDLIPISYAQLLPQLLASQLVQLRELGPPPNPLPRGYDINAHCEFHSGAPSHTIENSRAFK